MFDVMHDLSPARLKRLALKTVNLAEWRIFARRSEVGLLVAGIAVGITSGFAVIAMSFVSLQLHKLIFGISDYERVSSADLRGDASPVEKDGGDTGIGAFVRLPNDFLQPNMNARQAAALFDRTESDALAVVNNLIERRVVGLLTESHTLRRYSEELDRRRREASGEL